MRRGGNLPSAPFGGPDPLGDALMGDCSAGRTATNLQALALCGDPARVESMADQAAKAQPLSTPWNVIQLPILHAAIVLRRDQPEKAVELLQPLAHYERAYPQAIYLRGQAFLKLHKSAEAAAEFQKILDHRSAILGPYSLVSAVSYVWLARAANLSGDTAKARKAYQDFLALWKDSDADIPILIEARNEYAATEVRVYIQTVPSSNHGREAPPDGGKRVSRQLERNTEKSLLESRLERSRWRGGPGARGHLEAPRQCERVDVLPDLRHLAISNSEGEHPMVLELLVRGLDSPPAEADDQNLVSLRHELARL